MASPSGWSFVDEPKVATPKPPAADGGWSFADEAHATPLPVDLAAKSREMELNPPGVPKLGLPQGPQAIDNHAVPVKPAGIPVAPMGPGSFVPAPSAESNAFWKPAEAVEQIGQGFQEMAPAAKQAVQSISTGSPVQNVGLDISPDQARLAAGGAGKVISGGMELATPLLAPAIAAAPIHTFVALAAGTIADMGVKAGLESLGVPEEYAQLGGSLAALIAGYGAGKIRFGKEAKSLVDIIKEEAKQPKNGKISHLMNMVDRGTQHESDNARSLLKKNYGIEYDGNRANAPEETPVAPAEAAPTADGWSFADEKPAPAPAAAPQSHSTAGDIAVGATIDTGKAVHKVTEILPDGRLMVETERPTGTASRPWKLDTFLKAGTVTPPQAEQPAAAPSQNSPSIEAEKPEEDELSAMGHNDLLSMADKHRVETGSYLNTDTPSGERIERKKLELAIRRAIDKGKSEPEPPATPELKTVIAPAETPREEEAPYRYSSTQVNLPSEYHKAFADAVAGIPDADLNSEEGASYGGKTAGSGRETEPHVTALYGLHSEHPTAVKKILAEQGPIKGAFGKVSIFEMPDADVVKLDIDSPDLHDLNARLRKLDHTNKFPDYEPHMTLAYVRKGEGAKYVGKEVPGLTGKEVTFNRVMFSGKDQSRTDIPLKATETEAPATEEVEPSTETIAPVTETKPAATETKPKHSPAQITEAKAYTDRLLNPPKKEYAQKYAGYLTGKWEAPAVPKKLAEEHAVDVRSKLDKILGAAENATPKVSKPATADTGKTKLDLLLDKVSPRHEVTFNVEGYSEADRQRVIDAAQSRGFDAAFDGKSILVRDSRTDAGEKISTPVEKPSTQVDAKPDNSAALATAKALRTTADAMQKTIDQKRNPATANQNPTARRANIMSGMALEADALEKSQQTLRNLADAHEAGTVPEILNSIRSRAAIEDLSRSSWDKFPHPYINNSHIRDLEKLRGKPGTKAALDLLDRKNSAADGGARLTTPEQIETVAELVEKAEKAGITTAKYVKDNLAGARRLYKAGITPDNWTAAREAIKQYKGTKSAVPPAERQIADLERGLIGRKIEGFFPTPKTLAARMVEMADIEPGMSVLEPSAGNGRLADAIAEQTKELTTIEPVSDLRHILELKGHAVSEDRDFLAHKGEYDRIVMNPPFENGQDMDHVRHAFELLKPGGKIVAIMGEGAFFRGDKKATAFREWLDDNGGTNEKLDAGTFKESGTGTNTRLVTVEKPADTVTPARGEYGKSLGKEDRRKTLAGVRDVYQDQKVGRVEKGPDGHGEMRYGYPYSPEHFATSDITGAKIRHYVTLPDGRIAHPTELFPDITQSDIDRVMDEREHAETQRVADEKSRLKRVVPAGTTDQKEAANAIYSARGRSIDGSYFAENGTGDLVRVDGKHKDDVEFWDERGFRRVSEPTEKKVQSERGQPEGQPSERQAVREPRRPGNSSRYGQTAFVRIPSENRSFESRYAVRELEDVVPSHNPFTLQANPDYHFRNDRNYADARNAERILKQTKEFDPEFVVTESPDANNGAPVIDSAGNVLGGNSRTMTIARVYKQKPAAAKAYRELIEKKAAQFGLKPEDVAAMKQPVLVRELTREVTPDSAQAIITDLNKVGTASLTSAERAIADSGRISEETLQQFAGMVDSLGPSGTLAKALEGKGGVFAANLLVKDGVITTAEKPTLFSANGDLTPAAKERIGKLMLGRLFDDSAQFESAAPALRNKLERIVAPLSRVAGKADWDLLTDVKSAIQMIETARATGNKNLDDLVAQQGLFGGGEEYSPRTVTLAKFINGTGPVKLAQAFNRYANDSRGPTMFGEVTPGQAFEDAFTDNDTDLPQFSRDIPAPGFYSQLEEVIEAKIPAKVQKEQALAIIRNPQNGIKADELKWTGIEDAILKHEGPLTKVHLQRYAEEGRVQVTEVLHGPPVEVDEGKLAALLKRDEYLGFETLGEAKAAIRQHDDWAARWDVSDPELIAIGGAFREHRQASPTKYQDYLLPGGKLPAANYRELLLTLPVQGGEPIQWGPGKHVNLNLQVHGGGSNVHTKEWESLDGNYRITFHPHRGYVGWSSRVQNADLGNPYRDTAETLMDDLPGAVIGKFQSFVDVDAVRSGVGAYKSGHWNERNVLAHVRFTDRLTPDGKKVLLVEEIQSDWHQEGRKKGYRVGGEELNRRKAEFETARQAYAAVVEEASDIKAELENNPYRRNSAATSYKDRYVADSQRRNEIAGRLTAAQAALDAARDQIAPTGVPDAPFQKTWHELAFRRALRHAVENGYDQIAWVGGAAQAKRYDLSKQVSKVAWEPLDGPGMDPGDGTLYAFDKNGRNILSTVMKAGDIEDHVGKEVARKLLDAPLVDGQHAIEGKDLRVGGHGMLEFYDQLLPRYVSKYAKKWGETVGQSKIFTGAKTSLPGEDEIADLERQLQEAHEAAKLESGFKIGDRVATVGAAPGRGGYSYSTGKVYEVQATSEGNLAWKKIGDFGGERAGRSNKFIQELKEAAEYPWKDSVSSWDAVPASPATIAIPKLELQLKDAKKSARLATVHALNINEAMRESVMAGQPLFVQGGWTSVDTAPSDNPNSTGIPKGIYRNGTILVNGPAMAAIGSTWGHPFISGVRLLPQHTERVIAHLRGDRENFAIVNLLQEHKHEDLAVGSNVGSLRAAKETIRHERFHQAQSKLAGHLGDIEQKFLANPLADRASKVLASLGYSRDSHAIEIGAHLAAGQFTKLGLTFEEAKKLAYSYFKALRFVHGDERVDNVIQHGIMPLIAREARRSGTANQLDAGGTGQGRAQYASGRQGVEEPGGIQPLVRQDIPDSPDYSRTGPAAGSSSDATRYSRLISTERRGSPSSRSVAISRKAGEAAWVSPDGEEIPLNAGELHADLLNGGTAEDAYRAGWIRQDRDGITVDRLQNPHLIKAMARARAHTSGAILVEYEIKNGHAEKSIAVPVEDIGEFVQNPRRYVARHSGMTSETGSAPMLIDISQSIGKAVSEGYGLVRDQVIPAGTLVRNQGPAGQALMDLIDRANDVGEVEAGKRLAELIDVGLGDLSRDENFLLQNVLQGDVDKVVEQPEDVQDHIFGVATVVRAILDKMGQASTKAKVQVAYSRLIYPGDPVPDGLTDEQIERLASGRAVRITGKRDFVARSFYYPHVIRDVSNMKRGRLREDILENLVSQEIVADKEEGELLLDAYIRFIEDGGREKVLIDHMVDTGQARSKAEAVVKLNRFRQRTIKRSGSMEHAREIDLPFYDPIPARVLPTWIAQNSIRLTQIQMLGQENQLVNHMVTRVAQTGGDAELTRKAVDVIMNIVNEGDTGAAKISRFLRMLQGFKLGMASIPNAFQSLNTYLKSDLSSTAYGLGRYLTPEGRRFGTESGAALESVINESLRHAGGGDNVLGKFLRATGFSATERMNRIVAANAGAKYATRLFEDLQRNRNNTRAWDTLEQFGINPENALEDGVLTPDDILIFAKKFTDLTQFRSRPQDIPLFASSPAGKVFFQFKSYIYGQTRLLNDEIIGEIKAAVSGGGGGARRSWRALRALLILAILFPMAGEVISDIRAIMKGQKRKTKGLDRYLDDVAQVGTAGILGDLINASHYQGGILKWAAGPSVSEVADWSQRALNPPRKRVMFRAAFREVPGFGPLLVDRVFPLDKPKRRPTPRYDE